MPCLPRLAACLSQIPNRLSSTMAQAADTVRLGLARAITGVCNRARVFPTSHQAYFPSPPTMPCSPGNQAPENSAGTQRTSALYALFPTMDTLLIAIGTNLQRDNQNKPMLPLIAKDQAVFERLHEQRGVLINLFENLQAEYAITARLPCLMSRNVRVWRDFATQVGYETTDFLRQASSSLRRLEIHSADDALSGLNPATDKLSIIGHCEAGAAVLETVSDAAQPPPPITAQELASELARHGLPLNFSDIRLLGCNGADARYPTSFDPQELERCAQAYLRARPAQQDSDAVLELAQPFAAHLSNALKAEGFSAPRVSGYHGFQVMMPGADGKHHRSTLLNPHIPDQRRSDVRQVFTPSEVKLSDLE